MAVETFFYANVDPTPADNDDDNFDDLGNDEDADNIVKGKMWVNEAASPERVFLCLEPSGSAQWLRIDPSTPHAISTVTGLQAAIDAKAGIAVERGFKAVRSVTAADTAVLADAGGLIDVNAAGASNMTIPANASVAYPIGSVLTWCFRGAGACTMTPGGAAVLLPNVGKTLVVSAHEATKMRIVQATKVLTDTWIVSGDLESV